MSNGRTLAKSRSKEILARLKLCQHPVENLDSFHFDSLRWETLTSDCFVKCRTFSRKTENLSEKPKIFENVWDKLLPCHNTAMRRLPDVGRWRTPTHFTMPEKRTHLRSAKRKINYLFGIFSMNNYFIDFLKVKQSQFVLYLSRKLFQCDLNFLSQYSGVASIWQQSRKIFSSSWARSDSTRNVTRQTNIARLVTAYFTRDTT